MNSVDFFNMLQKKRDEEMEKVPWPADVHLGFLRSAEKRKLDSEKYFSKHPEYLKERKEARTLKVGEYVVIEGRPCIIETHSNSK